MVKVGHVPMFSIPEKMRMSLCYMQAKLWLLQRCAHICGYAALSRRTGFHWPIVRWQRPTHSTTVKYKTEMEKSGGYS